MAPPQAPLGRMRRNRLESAFAKMIGSTKGSPHDRRNIVGERQTRLHYVSEPLGPLSERASAGPT
jgi:hypothetical protein